MNNKLVKWMQMTWVLQCSTWLRPILGLLVFSMKPLRFSVNAETFFFGGGITNYFFFMFYSPDGSSELV